MKRELQEDAGRMRGMVDVSAKNETFRFARAKAIVKLKESIIDLIKSRKILKGDVFEQAKVAGIMAAKKTSDIIPLCHPLRITEVSISFSFIKDGVLITSEVSALDRTGVEMEALVACSIAALTIYDMCKMYNRGIEIRDIMLLEKRGGKSGTYVRGEKIGG